MDTCRFQIDALEERIAPTTLMAGLGSDAAGSQAGLGEAAPPFAVLEKACPERIRRAGLNSLLFA